jgi:very-short-patch-repair endonuclease
VSAIPKPLSEGEELFAAHCKIYKLSPIREWRVCKDRRWRVDFCFEQAQVVVEIEGGTWMNGRHNRGNGYSGDLEKYNRLAKMGFRVLRYTTAMVHSGAAIDDVLEILKGDL